jgi:hypothetical protein
MDLYNLPKDMLVKLVSEIREEAIKETENKYKESIYILIQNAPNLKIVSCFHCRAFIVFDYSLDLEMAARVARQMQAPYNDEYKIMYKSEDWIESFADFTPCSYFKFECQNYLCKKHIGDFRKLKAMGLNGTEYIDLCPECDGKRKYGK